MDSHGTGMLLDSVIGFLIIEKSCLLRDLPQISLEFRHEPF